MSKHTKAVNHKENETTPSKLCFLFSTPVSCGFPSPAEDYIETPLDLNERLIHKPAATYFVKAKGQSMHPTIEANDLLVVDRSKDAINNSIIVATLDGDFTVKRLIKRNDRAFLVADNPTFKEIEITNRPGFSVWGVVIHTIRSF